MNFFMMNMASKIVLLAEKDRKRFEMFLHLSDGNLSSKSKLICS